MDYLIVISFIRMKPYILGGLSLKFAIYLAIKKEAIINKLQPHFLIPDATF